MRFYQGVCEQRPLVGTVSKELVQKRIGAEQTRHDKNAAIAILNIGRMNDGVEQEA